MGLLGAGESVARADTTTFPLVATFLDLCGETRGDARQALSIADHDGWAIPPAKALQPPAFLSAHWTALDGRVFHGLREVRLLQVGIQADPGGHAAQSCSVAVWTRQPASLEDIALIQTALAKWVGGDPVKADAATGFAQFAFREVGGERHPLAANDPALSADLPPADVAEVTMSSVFGKPFIQYMRWR
jgi:hypothetical protein